jgi:hypothetical protein
MEVSRRTFITSVVAGSAVAAIPGTGLLSGVAYAASPPGDVVGKITVGYQGWFACIGDGSPINGWWHWAQNMSQPPSPSNTGIKAWPDMREYTKGYQTAYANMNNGQPATLFSSYDQQTVNTQFQWMQQNGCDTAALQRFNPNGSEGPIRDAITAKVRTAAETYSRKFYIMYDVSGWTNMQSEIKTDWTSKMSAHTASTAYAKQNGKPVVCIWGFGFNDNNHPATAAQALDVINWFKSQGCYVIGGVPTYWRTGVNDSRAGYIDTYHAFNMISPWMVGRIGNAGDSDNFYNNVNQADQADCNAHSIDYQPCVLPGDLSVRQRAHGDFMWRQFYNMVRVGAQGIYISMFDEFNEGNQIAKTAETQAMVPSNAGMLALDEDGTACSSDYYLRITADGGKMLKGQIALTATRPTLPVVGSTPPPPPPGTNLALHKPTSDSGHSQGFVSGNAVDGDVNTYWESINNTFPQWLQVDLGAAASVGKIVLKLPSSWGTRTQTLSVLGSTNGSTFSTLAGSATYSFNPATGNTVTISVPATSAQQVRLSFSANSGWPAGQIAEFEVYAADGTPPPPPPNVNLAQGKPASDSGHVQNYVPGNTVDGNTGSYWESTNSAFPQWLQVDLGTATAISRVVLKLPPSWGSRSQTLSVLGSTNGSTFSTLSGSAGRSFDPASGNTVTITFTSATTRYVRLNFTANTSWPAGQLSEFEVYAT